MNKKKKHKTASWAVLCCAYSFCYNVGHEKLRQSGKSSGPPGLPYSFDFPKQETYHAFKGTAARTSQQKAEWLTTRLVLPDKDLLFDSLVIGSPKTKKEKEKNMHIVVCGNGKMADAVIVSANHCDEHKGVLATRYGVTDKRADVAVHFGSGRQLPLFLKYCGDQGIPLIQGSTGQKLPEDVPVPVIDAPNLALPVVAFLKALPGFWRAFEALHGVELPVRVMESHQQTKKTLPGTAVKMANVFNVGESQIVSVRIPTVQEKLGVPAEHLERHGYHWVTIRGYGVEICLSTKVNGLAPYADGVIHVARRVVCSRATLTKRIYPVTDFV